MKSLEERWKKKKEFTKELFKDFPKLFKYKDDKMKSLMCFGCECGKGWYPLIRRLVENIEMVRKGRKLKDVEIVQIKEKFGGLRVYVDGNKEILDLTLEAEKESYKICERCGKKGKLRTKGWYYTLCSSCNNERYEKKNWSVYE